MDEDVDAVAEARSDDVQVALNWRADDSGRLTGELIVRNVSVHSVRLSSKPGLQPLGRDGAPLEADTVISLELQLPGYVVIGPGEAAVAPVGWAGWNGEVASGEVRVQWPGGQVTVVAQGARQPTATGPATNLWSSWFKRASDVGT